MLDRMVAAHDRGLLGWWLASTSLYLVSKRAFACSRGKAYQVHVDLGAQQPRRLAVLDPYLQQLVGATGFEPVSAPSRGPSPPCMAPRQPCSRGLQIRVPQCDVRSRMGSLLTNC